MNAVKHRVISCPHCGSMIDISLDASSGDQDYYESCSVCCRDIHMHMHINEARHRIELSVGSDNEQYF